MKRTPQLDFPPPKKTAFSKRFVVKKLQLAQIYIQFGSIKDQNE